MALKRRFGARETRAGNWKAFAATILGSEIIVPDDSEADRELDVSFTSSFNGYKKSRSHGPLARQLMAAPSRIYS